MLMFLKQQVCFYQTGLCITSLFLSGGGGGGGGELAKQITVPPKRLLAFICFVKSLTMVLEVRKLAL